MESIPESGEDCPDYVEGITDEFTTEVSDQYASFVLEGDPIALAADDGSPDCYPFAESVGSLADYPESSNPQCQRSSEDGVCAFLFSSAASDTCTGRRYSLETFSSSTVAAEAGAIVTHDGGT